MNYLADLYLVDTTRSVRSDSKRGQSLAFSAGDLQADIDAWLRANKCPALYQWAFRAQSGSNTPAARGVLNTAHYDLIKRGNESRGDEVVKTLLITVFAMRPIDPIQEQLL